MTLANPLKTARIACAVLLTCASVPGAAVELPDGDRVADVGANAVTMDLATLEDKVRDTKAIGVFQKLALKGEIDDLMDEFRSHYRSNAGTPVALRKPYEQLLDKVAAALQGKDPVLARAITASRNSIWAALSDSNKFAGL